MTAMEIRRHDLPCNALGQRRQAGGWPGITVAAKANFMPAAEQDEGDRAPREYRHASIHHAIHCADLAARPGAGSLAAPRPGLATWSRDHAPADVHSMTCDHWRPGS